MSVIEVDCVESIKNTLEKNLNPYGFEFQPFKVAWYNSLVQPIFRINCNEDTVAFLVISNPRMFESAFIPFIRSQAGVLNNLNDPIDQCMVYYLSKVSEIFPDHDVKIIHDFELHPNRRPKVVMQSIAHASGVAYFYHPKSVPDHNWSNEKMFGVCIHPKYGGWFALRAVIFFENLYCPNLPQSLPKDVIPSKEDRLKLLELYNFHWKDWRFRDIFPVAEKYSEMQINYFSTPPNKRHDVIKDLLNTLSYTNGH